MEPKCAIDISLHSCMRGNGAIYPGYLLFIALDEYQLLLLSRERNKLYIMRPAFLVFSRKVFHMQRHPPTNNQSRYIEHIETRLELRFSSS